MAATSLPVAGGNTALRRLPRRPSVSCRALTGSVSATSSTEKQAYWSGINADVEAYLDRSFPAAREPAVVHRSLRELVLSAAPRTMAPALVVAAADLAGGAATRSDAVAVAAAFHAFFAAAHAHEYLPGVIETPAPAASTTPANIRLLCGADGIHPFVFGVLARTLGSDPVRATRVMVEMARLMGSQGYVLGQYMHVKWARGDQKDGGGGVLDVCEKKEGELFSGAAACGALLAGADEGDAQKLRRFGFYVGMIYGMLYGTGREERKLKNMGRAEQVASFRTSALKELEGFRGYDQMGKVDYMSSLVDVVSETA